MLMDSACAGFNDTHAAADVQKSCEQTIKDLKCDYLDEYLVHWPVGVPECLDLCVNADGTGPAVPHMRLCCHAMQHIQRAPHPSLALQVTDVTEVPELTPPMKGGQCSASHNLAPSPPLPPRHWVALRAHCCHMCQQRCTACRVSSA